MIPPVIVITGPTASGKSALAIELARKLGTEIVSADSRQVFQGIPIVTALPTPEDRAAATHHLIDFLPLDAYYSVSEFEHDALQLTAEIGRRCGCSILCGGSMMYVDTFCHGIDLLPTIPAGIRAELASELKERGEKWLLEELSHLDPVYYRKVDRANIKRVFHAVEIIRASGRAYSDLRTGRRVERSFPVLKICLTGSRDVLFSRINRRVDLMMESGLEEEARRVYPFRGLNSLNTVGLKEMFAWFDGTMSREIAIERIKKNTRVYAKKQLTWYKRDPEVRYLEVGDGLVERALEMIRTLGL